jgi:hypothetical protein
MKNNSASEFNKEIEKNFTTSSDFKLNTDTMRVKSKIKNEIGEIVNPDLEKSEEKEVWSEKYKKSIDCSNPKGFSQKAHCAGRKKKKRENKESTGSGSAGAYSGPVFGGNDEFWERSRKETPNLEKIEATEATGSGSVGAYSTPAIWAPNKKNWGPSKKTQYPGGKFVSVKEKCKKFPYCNQGDINALNITENKIVKDAIKNVADKIDINENIIIAILEYEYKKLNKRYL